MNEITIPLKDFCRELNEMLSDGMDYVTLTILDPDSSDPAAPPSLNLTAFSADAPDADVFYDNLNAVDVTPPQE